VGGDTMSGLAAGEAQVVVEAVVPLLLADAGNAMVDAVKVHRVRRLRILRRVVVVIVVLSGLHFLHVFLIDQVPSQLADEV